MKKRINIVYESSEPFTGRQLIAAVERIQLDFDALGFKAEPAIDTHGNDGVHKVIGWLEAEVDL